jgi:ATP-dependent Clp protease ATP-binding subunit ClpA
MLAEILTNVREQYGVSVEFGEGTKEFIVRTGFSQALGARELRRSVERLVQAPLSEMVLNGRLKEHCAWQVTLGGGGLVFTPAIAGTR